jgi:hypothetical protein
MKSGLLCSPPGSTDLTQPLDIATWRSILKTWEGTSESTRYGILYKDVFPFLEAVNEQTFGIQE